MCSLMAHRPVPVNEKQKERHRFVSQSYEYRVCAVSSYTLRQNAKGEGMPTKVDVLQENLPGVCCMCRGLFVPRSSRKSGSCDREP